MKTCTICDKRSHLVNKLNKLRGKYNPVRAGRQKPNLQWVTIPVEIKKPLFKEFAGKRILACTKCIKAIGKEK
ncbi:MAG: hypothetical protein ABH967_00420 [Patescibacteria group bacterium]